MNPSQSLKPEACPNTHRVPNEQAKSRTNRFHANSGLGEALGDHKADGHAGQHHKKKWSRSKAGPSRLVACSPLGQKAAGQQQQEDAPTQKTCHKAHEHLDVDEPDDHATHGYDCEDGGFVRYAADMWGWLIFLKGDCPEQERQKNREMEGRGKDFDVWLLGLHQRPYPGARRWKTPNRMLSGLILVNISHLFDTAT